MGKKTDLKDSCSNCKQISCLNLFRHTKNGDEFIGGELYVYKLINVNKIHDEELSLFVCKNGKLFQSACFVIAPLNVALPNERIAVICNEVIRDMKASLYLAMSGHYRQATIILRCVFENFLFGLYFYAEEHIFAKNDDEKKDVQRNFKVWIKGGYRKSDKDLLDVIKRARLITKEEEKEWEKLFQNLSQFVHTILNTETGREIIYGKVKILDCYSEVKFNKDNLKEWSGYYQRLIFIILNKLLILYPFLKNKDAGILALKNIRVEFKNEKAKINNNNLDSLYKMKSHKVKEAPKSM